MLVLLFIVTTAASLLLAGPGQGKFGSCSATSNTRSLEDALPRQVRERYARWIYWAGDIHGFPPTRFCRLYAWEGPYPNIRAGSIVTTTGSQEAIPSYYRLLGEKSTPGDLWYEIWVALVAISLLAYVYFRVRIQPVGS